MKIKVTSLKNNSVRDVYSMKDKIDPNPEYQREGDLWSLEQKQLLIDSIITGFDIPKIYLHVLSKSNKPNSKQYAIIDGKQRLEAIWGFVNNVFSLGDLKYLEKKLDMVGMRYRDLSYNYPKFMSTFNKYSLPVMLVETPIDPEDTIEEMFSRLNDSVSINAAEKRNAMGGNVIKMIKILITKPFFQKTIKIKNKRYRYHEICIRLLFIEYCLCNEGIIDTKKPYLDSFTKKFKTSKIPSDVETTVKETLDYMHKIFRTKDNLLASQARIPIYYLLFREAHRQERLNKITREKINEFVKLVERNKHIRANNTEKENINFSEYDRLTIQGTSDASSIKTRFRIIAEHFGIQTSKIYYPQQQLHDS